MDENEMATENNTVVLSGGSVTYSMSNAASSIDAVIEALQQAKDDGAEFVVMSSGNYRGAKWASVGASTSWVQED